MCLCDQLRKLVAQVWPVGRMSLEPCHVMFLQHLFLLATKNRSETVPLDQPIESYKNVHPVLM